MLFLSALVAGYIWDGNQDGGKAKEENEEAGEKKEVKKEKKEVKRKKRTGGGVDVQRD